MIDRPDELADFAGFAHVSDTELDARIDRPEEVALLSPSAVDVRRRAFRRGRLAGHEALASIGLDTGPILVGDNREPLWPGNAIGAISHAGDVSVALVAPSQESGGVGVDVELFRDVPELLRYVPVSEERAWLLDQGAEERALSLVKIFSAKEAIFKAFYPRVRQFFGFDSAMLEPHDRGFTATLISPIDREYPPDREFVVHCRAHENVVMSWLTLPPDGAP